MHIKQSHTTVSISKNFNENETKNKIYLSNTKNLKIVKQVYTHIYIYLFEYAIK